MARAIFKRSKAFHGLDEKGGTRTLTVSVASDPQEVPDWVCPTPTYVIGVRDGSILELVIKQPEAPLPPPVIHLPPPVGLVPPAEPVAQTDLRQRSKRKGADAA
jgi:hypothetical protein